MLSFASFPICAKKGPILNFKFRLNLYRIIIYTMYMYMYVIHTYNVYIIIHIIDRSEFNRRCDLIYTTF